MSRLLAPLALLALLVPSALAADSSRGIEWLTWDRGLEQARASGRPVLVDVYTDWCSVCRRMDADVYSRAEIRDYLVLHFVPVRLNAEASDPIRYQGRLFTSGSLAGRFGVSGYPTTIFLRPEGEHIVSVPGYQKPGVFLLVLRFIGEGYMDRGVSFRDFLRRSGASGDSDR